MLLTPEMRRLEVLRSYELFGSDPEEDYDQVTELCARLFRAPICLMSLVGEDAQWLKSRYGLDVASTPRDVAFCAHTLTMDEPLVVLDAMGDDRFRDNPLVTGAPHIRFYAGAPLIDDNGMHLGALCVIDTQSRTAFDPDEARLLKNLAAIAMRRMRKGRIARAGVALGGFADASPLAMITATAAGNITFWNKAAERVFGHSAKDVIGRSLNVIVPERFRAQHKTGLDRMVAGHQPRLAGKSVEVMALRSDGTEFPIEIAISSWHGLSGIEIGANIQDITARREREVRLQHLAHHDPLTGLTNRHGFIAGINACIAENATGAMLALDLDGFKSINDSFGHSMGDAALQAVALKLRAAVESSGLVGRIGGDEFAILLPNTDDPIKARALAADLMAEFAAPLHIAGHSFQIGVSCGVALAPLHAVDAEELLLRADLALLTSKREGGRRIRMFDAGMASQLNAARAFKSELRQATDEGQWELFYQPQVSLRTGQSIGAEALLRWRHPTRGLLAPAAFISVLENHRVAFRVGSWVIDQACAQLARWRADGIAMPRVSVNLFAAQFTTGNLEQVVMDAIARHGLVPRDVEVEVTETIALRPDDQVSNTLHALCDAGVGIALDDFGTGFASLTTLKHIPVTRLKIDKSFVQDICTDAHSAAIVASITSLTRRLGLEVIAEGIETQAQVQMLMELGCDDGQGYLFGRPAKALAHAEVPTGVYRFG